MKPLEIMRIKDFMREMNCGRYTATKIRDEIAEHFSIDKYRITYKKFEEYFILKPRKHTN